MMMYEEGFLFSVSVSVIGIVENQNDLGRCLDGDDGDKRKKKKRERKGTEMVHLELIVLIDV